MPLISVSHPTRRRSRAIIASLAVAALALLPGQVVSARDITTSMQSKPTIVLEHGAWADGSSWDGVVQRLQADGYTVDVPPNPLLGLASDPAYLADFLKTITGPIVLVGHSYGGAVITNAATGNPQVKALVYVDAFIPAKGETVLQLAGAKHGRLQLRTIPGSPEGRLPALSQAERVYQLLRERAAGQTERSPGCRPAARAGEWLCNTLGSTGVEDNPILVRDRHAGPDPSASGAALHVQACKRPHHRNRRGAFVHDHAASSGHQRDHASGPGHSVSGARE